MPLDLALLENIKRHTPTKTTARCPVCAEVGGDKTGNHLFIRPTGEFGCAAHANDELHRKRIFALVGLKNGDYAKNIAPESLMARPVPASVMAPPPDSETHAASRIITVDTPFECAYDYTDETGKLLYQVRRYVPKSFRPYNPSTRKLSLEGISRVPYRLPEVIKSSSVWIVEGEKDADALAALGYCATSRAGGSSIWEEELTPWFAGKDVILCGDNDFENPAKPGDRYMKLLESFLTPVAKSVRRVWVPKPHKDIAQALEGLSDEEARAVVDSLTLDPLLERFHRGLFDILKPPTRTEPVLWINDAGVAKPGDLVVIQAQSKAGKSSFLTAIMASLMAPESEVDRDFLGCRGENKKCLPLLHFDTEQSPEDHYDMMARAVRRAGIDAAPGWVKSRALADWSIEDRRRLLARSAAHWSKPEGALCAILIDGCADMIHDVNDPKEANPFVDELFAIAIHCACPLICVIHENHGGNNDGKTRGHLGSQLMRKAATNLRLEKDANTGIIQVWGERMRRGHIGKGTGPHFQWVDDAGMHVSCESASDDKKRADISAIKSLINDVFAGRGAIRYNELVSLVMKAKGVQDKTAQKTVTKMLPFLTKSEFGYSKS